ncbi:hypothetical protein ES708_13824 [subsurface metagenome]
MIIIKCDLCGQSIEEEPTYEVEISDPSLVPEVPELRIVVSLGAEGSPLALCPNCVEGLTKAFRTACC